jgi:hypothetical protein
MVGFRLYGMRIGNGRPLLYRISALADLNSQGLYRYRRRSEITRVQGVSSSTLNIREISRNNATKPL